MGVETWNYGDVNIWEGVTDRTVHLEGGGPHTVRASNKAITYLRIFDGAGNDDISVGALNTEIYSGSGNDRYFIESGINATIYNGSGYKNVGSNYLAGSINVYETNWWSQRNTQVSARYSYVQSGFADDTISAYGLSQALVEDAGGNNTVHLSGSGYLKASLGHGSNNVHLWSGWGADIVQSGGNLSVSGHEYRGGDTTIQSTDHWGTSFYNLAYDGSSWSTKVDARVSNHATINAYGLSWNSINLWGSDGGSKLDISSPGSNVIWATRGNDLINFWMGGSWTEVNLDSGNDELRIHSGVSAKVTMNSGDKTIVTNHLAGDLNIHEGCWWGNSRRSIHVSAGNTFVQTGFGDDTINAFGLWSTRVEDAGGNNSIEARGAGVIVRTGHGNDTIDVSGVSARVSSGNGNDRVTLDGVDAHLDDGDTWGDKRVLARAGGAYVDTGHGNDTVDFHGLGTRIATAGGNDTVVARGIGASIDTGAGDDVVDLRAAGATLNTGDGNDRVWSLGIGGQGIDLGNGDDTVEAYGGVNVIHAGRWGRKSVTVGGGANVVQVGHGDSTVHASGGLNVVLTGHGSNVVDAYGGGNFVLNGNGRFSSKVYGGLNVVLTGQGAATLDAYGSTNILMAGDGGNTIRAYGVGYLTGIGNLIISGSGNDRIKAGSLLGVATTSFGVSDDEFSFDRVVVMDKDAGETIKKTTLNIVSLVLNAATNAGNIVIAGDGHNKVKAFGGYNMIQSGSGDDEVTMVGGFNGALVGNGRNRIFSIGSANIVVAGSGHDEMQALGGANVFFANAGNNRMTAIGGGNLFVAADGDDDMLAVGGGNIAILGGGNNTALLAGGLGNVVQAGSGDDRVISLGQWNVMVLGDGNNTVGALGGGGNLVWTGSGNDTVIALGLYVGNILLLGDGNNFAIAGGRANVVLTGSGRDSVLAVGQYNLVSTANGIDNVIAIGQYNLVHTGGDADIAAVIGQTNFVHTGWGDDVAVVVGKTNIVLTEAGDDVALVIGQNNFMLSGSGHDMVGVFGETNYVLTGSGHDLVAVFGTKNRVATDNEIVFTDDDLGALKESKKVKGFNAKDEDWSKKTGMDVSTQAELKLSMDLSFYFPDIEFSTPNSNDWKYPTLTLPSVSYQIPSTPALRSSPAYEYGTLGSYGLPSLSFPLLSTPELQLPGITVPSFSLPNFEDMGVDIGQLKPNFFVDFNVGSDWLGGASSGFQSLTGLPGPTGGSSGTLLGGKLSVQPKVTGDVGFDHADLTGKVSGHTEASANAIVAHASTHASGQAAASTDGTNSSSGKVFGAGNVFSDAGSASASSATSTGTTSSGTEYALPTLSFGDIKLPDLQLNGFDFGGYAKLFTTLFSGRDLFGATLPDFSLPEFKVDDIKLSDHVGGTQALTIKGTSYALPSLSLPRVAGLDYQSRLPSLGTNYRFNQGEGDVAVVGGQDNRVMTGPGDDLALVLGQTNILLMGEGNDAGLLVGEKNAWRGGKGNDFILAGGKENTLKGQEDNDVVLALGLTNKVEGGSGDDVLLALGKSNAVDGGEGKDLMLVIGMNNDINGKAEDTTGDGNDTLLVLGMENTVKAGRGDDWVIACGMTNDIDGGQGGDMVLAVGWSNKVYGDFSAADNGNDVVAFLGGKNQIQGNGGNDLILGAGLGNVVQGNAGKDIVLTAGLAQQVDLGEGDDRSFTLGASNAVQGGLGNDVMYVAGATNNVMAGSGDDVLFAIGAANLLWGQDGNDVFLARGIASRQLADVGKLSCTVDAIDRALDALDSLGRGLSGEAVPKTLDDYVRSDNTNAYAYGAAGSDSFYSGFQNLIADGGEGDDRYAYYLGDGRMTVRDLGTGSNTLTVHAEQIRSLGASVDIVASDLYYNSASRTISVIKAGTTYGEIVLDGFGGKDDAIVLQGVDGAKSVALSSMASHAGGATTPWSPTLPASTAGTTAPVDMAKLYDYLDSRLAINAAVLA
ncbi:calcium-binding protein [Leptothrix discophora]|uniref:Calcium-binding protein n=1 Tax=Leptothrix discophora TaxID=89 RepID=A0ABT9FYH3_LEPDI|nr:calcium-binding protein [Leptothrix discophora]MDP4299286.1 calcium-binding protein [Leptothrix discophora]